MVKIKGPIKISGGFNARKFMEEQVKNIKLKLPFTAAGWKSSKNSDLVEGGKVVEKKTVKKAKKAKK